MARRLETRFNGFIVGMIGIELAPVIIVDPLVLFGGILKTLLEEIELFLLLHILFQVIIEAIQLSGDLVDPAHHFRWQARLGQYDYARR